MFKRKGRGELTEKEFVLSASMDFRWFPPKDAQRLLQRGLETNLLQSGAGVIRPAFDVDSVEVPRDFVPTSSILEGVPRPSEDVFSRIVGAMTDRLGGDRKAAVAAINAVQERMDVDLEVAALVAAYRAGIDVRPFQDLVEERLKRLGPTETRPGA